MAIQIAGAVYCPLSSRNLQHSLYSLLQWTGSGLVFVHHQTRHQFDDTIHVISIDTTIAYCSLCITLNAADLSKVTVISDNICFSIFTSGSTGKPKPVSFSNIIY